MSFSGVSWYGGSLTLRLANLQDLESLVELEEECFPHDPWQPDSLQKALQESGYLVLVAEGEAGLLGYLVGWHVGDEADLARLGVLARARRGGVGRALLQRALSHWQERQVQLVFLDVRAGNAAARGLYAGLGFQEVGRRRSYYADGEDAIQLRFEFPSPS